MHNDLKLIDIGGQKHRRTMGGKWKVLDIREGADYIHDLNSGKPLPLKTDSVDGVYCSHVLEHLELELITPILKELYRILKPNGKLRIIVPDVDVAIQLYINNKLMDRKYCYKPKYIPAVPMGYLTTWFSTPGHGHNIGFNEELLRAYIAKAKFKNVMRLKYNKCSKIFEGKDYAIYEGWCLYIEAEK